MVPSNKETDSGDATTSSQDELYRGQSTSQEHEQDCDLTATELHHHHNNNVVTAEPNGIRQLEPTDATPSSLTSPQHSSASLDNVAPDNTPKEVEAEAMPSIEKIENYGTRKRLTLKATQKDVKGFWEDSLWVGTDASELVVHDDLHTTTAMGGGSSPQTPPCSPSLAQTSHDSRSVILRRMTQPRDTYNKSIMAASATLAYIQDICSEDQHAASVCRLPGETVAMSARVTPEGVYLTVAGDVNCDPPEMPTSTNKGEEGDKAPYKCHRYFYWILLDAVQQYTDHNHRQKSPNTQLERHLNRLQNIIAGNWVLTPDEINHEPYDTHIIRYRVREYLAIASFPLFQRDAKIALKNTHGV
ncbi:hypothetical protein Daus18300_014512 [Diaporthe australafricana]|uniref:Uncharacterized protein n=1 Tax=Diaporthe australafricana TaxID=127596 RepID=A0ABR3VV01_9PEZI